MTAHSGDFDHGHLMRLSEEVTRIAGRLAQLTTNISASPDDAGAVEAKDSPALSLETVDWLIRARQRRTAYLSPDLFGEPAWDILLDLLRAEIVQTRVAVSSLCIASGVPMTTGLRWISSMVDRGLLVRVPDPFDGRRVFIELAPEVSQGLRRYFADVVGQRPKAG